MTERDILLISHSYTKRHIKVGISIQQWLDKHKELREKYKHFNPVLELN